MSEGYVRARGFCVMHRERATGAAGVARGRTAARAETRGEMLLDRNLASVVRDAPYALDHLSARSQRPIISRDTCACADKKRYVSPLEAFVEKAFSTATERIRVPGGAARKHVTPDNNDDGSPHHFSASLDYRVYRLNFFPSRRRDFSPNYYLARKFYGVISGIFFNPIDPRDAHLAPRFDPEHVALADEEGAKSVVKDFVI